MDISGTNLGHARNIYWKYLAHILDVSGTHPDMSWDIYGQESPGWISLYKLVFFFLPWPRSEGSAMTFRYPFFLVVVVVGFQA